MPCVVDEVVRMEDRSVKKVIFLIWLPVLTPVKSLCILDCGEALSLWSLCTVDSSSPDGGGNRGGGGKNGSGEAWGGLLREAGGWVD